MQSAPEPQERGPGVPEYFYPALGLPPLPAEPTALPGGTVPVEPTGQAPVPETRAKRVSTGEKIAVTVLAVVLVFVGGWWWGSRRPDSQTPAFTLGDMTVGAHGSLAGLSDDELFALLPTEEDYPSGWKVSRVHGSASPPAEDSGSRLVPAECDPRKAAKPPEVVGSVKGRSQQSLLGQTGSADVRLGRSPQGSGAFTAAQDFAKRCPEVTMSAQGVTAELRLTAERNTIPGAEESMTITMAGNLHSPQMLLDIPIVMTVTGARSRGLMVLGTGMRAGFDLGEPGEASDEEDVVGKLLEVTVNRINQK